MSNATQSLLVRRLPRHLLVPIFATPIFAMFAPAVQAEPPKLAAGLWELATVTDGETLAQRMGGKISPAMLKRLQRPGLQITETGLIRICLSQKTAERGWQPQAVAAGCHYDVKWDGPNGRFLTTCKGKTQSSGDILIASNKAWTSTSRAKPEELGRTVVQSTNAKWAGADCNGLKPK